MPGPLTGGASGLSEAQVNDLIAAAVAGKGVIGTASFDPSGASIGSPVYTGIVASAVYSGPGVYVLTFTGNQADADYGVHSTLPAVADRMLSAGVSGKAVGGFETLLNQTGENSEGKAGAAAAYDPASRITISITRLSQ